MNIDIEAIRSGERKALARGITLLESSRREHRAQAEKLLRAALPHSGNSIRVGLTGSPGAGKSTLIEVLGNHVIKREHRIAVLAVDPSSTLSGGSILGDKTRMPTLAANADAFIRPTPAGEYPGGVARRTRESILLCEAAGFDVIVVETVGVGQSETMVSRMTDIFLLLLLPGGGDELQGIKRGVMELADLVIINKADGDMASRANISAADIRLALRLIRPRVAGWTVPVMTASALENRRIGRIWDVIDEYRTRFGDNGMIADNRLRQTKDWLWTEIREQLSGILQDDPAVSEYAAGMEGRVERGEISPAAAASELIARFLGNIHGAG